MHPSDGYWIPLVNSCWTKDVIKHSTFAALEARICVRICWLSWTTFAKRAFRYSAPVIWNSLPKTVIDSDSVTILKSRLKTFLFSQVYSVSSSFSHYSTLPGPSASRVMTVRRYTNVYIIIIIIIMRLRRSRSAAAYSHQTFPWTICRSVQCIVEKWRIGSRCRLAS